MHTSTGMFMTRNICQEMLRVVVLNTSENGEHFLHSLDSEYKSKTKLMTILGPLVAAGLGHSQDVAT